MPKVLGYTPPWLSRPSAGSRAFHEAIDPPRASELAQDPDQSPYYGQRRLLAKRGTEVFVAVGNQIRWLDLLAVKSDWEANGGRPSDSPSSPRERQVDLEGQESGDSTNPAYRTLVTPIHHRIRQLIVSPSGHFLAILTEHTVHIAVLPDASHLAVQDRSPVKVKTHQLGPTTHVLPQSPVVSALWHPLACSTNSADCLVTVTAEAAVRVWEIDRNNLWSFDRPSLAIDLQKLADGTSCDGDFEPSGFGRTKGFSVDTFEMEVTSACFGGSGREEENGWSSMTLWTAMRNGDVYALCPLLPQKWKATSTLIPSLSTSVVSNMACLQDESVDADQKRAARQQFEWVQEIDNEESVALDAGADPTSAGQVRSLPLTPGAIPRLQGPFLFDGGENELDLDVSDMRVIPSKINAEDLLSGEEEDYADLEGLIQDRLSITVICLATTTGKVHVCLNLEDVSGQWLPPTPKDTFSVPTGQPRSLVLVESTQVGAGNDIPENRPLLAQDPSGPYDLYLTSSHRIDHLSLSSWASRLETELVSPGPATTSKEFRFKVLCGGEMVVSSHMADYAHDASWRATSHLSLPVVVTDEVMGDFLLTCSEAGPHAIMLERAEDTPHVVVLTRSRTESLAGNDSGPEIEMSLSRPERQAAPPRPAYEPPAIFYEPPAAPLQNFLSASVPQRHQKTLKQEISLSASTLDIMTAAHRILSLQTSQLEQAAAELFRRCERLREEMVDQVQQMTDLATRLQAEDESEGREVEGRNGRCEKRIARARDRQVKINERYEALRRKMGRATAGGRELSNKERAWIREIQAIGADLGLVTEMPVDDPAEAGSRRSVQERYKAVQDLSDSLVEEALEIQTHGDGDSSNSPSRSLHPRAASPLNRLSLSGVPAKVQKAKVEEAMVLVERETAVIEAVMASLDRLNHMQID